MPYNYVNPVGTMIIIVLFPVLDAIFLGARFWSHRINDEKFHLYADTYFAIAAWLFLLFCAIPLGVAWSHKMFGYASVPQIGYGGAPGISEFELVVYVYFNLWVVGITCAKATLLCFYRRLLGRNRVFRILTVVIMILAGIWCLCFFLLNLLNCGSNIRAEFEYAIPPFENPHCLNVITILFASAVTDCALDIAIIILPIPVIWGLQLPQRTRIGIVAIFAVGILCIAFSAVRLASWAAIWNALTKNKQHYTILGVDADNDFTSLSTLLFWSQVELGVAALVCNLPYLRPLFARARIGVYFSRLYSRARGWSQFTSPSTVDEK